MPTSKANPVWLYMLFWGTLFLGCSEPVLDTEVEAPVEEISFLQMEFKHDGLWYNRETDRPFTGIAVRHHDNGKKAWATTLQDGKPIGRVEEWDENGDSTWPGK